METESALSNQSEFELENDVVTVSKVQVALRATARHLSAQLSELALQAETDEPEGLYALMQQTATALLDQAAHWSHVLASSHTIDSRDAAEELFIQLSDRERRKFSVETLSNVDGVIQRQPIPLPDADEKPAYIVVTLLLGTEDDRPLFGELRSADDLRQVLKNIHTLRAPYLMVFELLWTPQDVMDVLTEEDLATQFNDLLPIAPLIQGA